MEKKKRARGRNSSGSGTASKTLERDWRAENEAVKRAERLEEHRGDRNNAFRAQCCKRAGNLFALVACPERTDDSSPQLKAWYEKRKPARLVLAARRSRIEEREPFIAWAARRLVRMARSFRLWADSAHMPYARPPREGYWADLAFDTVEAAADRDRLGELEARLLAELEDVAKVEHWWHGDDKDGHDNGGHPVYVIAVVLWGDLFAASEEELARRTAQGGDRRGQSVIDEALAAAKAQHEAYRQERDARHAYHKAGADARRAIRSAWKYCQPGARGIGTWPEHPHSDEVLRERFGTNPDWVACNDELCAHWVHFWEESVPHVLTAIGREAVEALKADDPYEQITRELYLRLLRADDPEAEAESVIRDLARARIELDGDRYMLQAFFVKIMVLVMEVPDPWDLDPAMLAAWEEARKPRAASDTAEEPGRRMASTPNDARDAMATEKEMRERLATGAAGSAEPDPGYVNGSSAAWDVLQAEAARRRDLTEAITRRRNAARVVARCSSAHFPSTDEEIRAAREGDHETWCRHWLATWLEAAKALRELGLSPAEIADIHDPERDEAVVDAAIRSCANLVRANFLKLVAEPSQASVDRILGEVVDLRARVISDFQAEEWLYRYFAVLAMRVEWLGPERQETATGDETRPRNGGSVPPTPEPAPVKKSGKRPTWIFMKDAAGEYGVSPSSMQRYVSKLPAGVKKKDDQGRISVKISALENLLRKKGKIK